MEALIDDRMMVEMDDAVCVDVLAAEALTVVGLVALNHFGEGIAAVTNCSPDWNGLQEINVFD